MTLISKIKDKFNKNDFMLVTLSTVVCSGLSFVFSVYAKRYLSTTLYGIYSSCLLLQTYLAYAQLGSFNAYNRDYPQALGRRGYDEAKQMKDAVISFMLLVYGILVVVTLAVLFALYSTGKIDFLHFFGFATAPIMMLIKNMDDLSVCTAKMYNKYKFTALFSLLRTIIAMGLAVLAVQTIGYYGLYVMPAMSAVLGVLFFWKYGLKNTKIILNLNYIKGMILSGMPLLVNSLIWTVVTSVDKFVILIFMTETDLGVYSVPLMGFTAMVVIPQSISQMFYFRISTLYGETGDTKALLDKAGELSGITAAITGAACVAAFYIMPIFVSFFMPMYTDGTVATQIILVGVAIYSTTMLFGNIFGVLKMNKAMILNSIYLCIFNIVFSTALVLVVGRNIECVAVGTALSYALYSLLLIKKLNSTFNYSFLKLFSKTWGPLLGIVAPSVLFYIFIPNIWISLCLSLFTVLAVCVIIKRTKH